MMVATLLSEETQLQLGSAVTSCTEPSENTAVAIKCSSFIVSDTFMETGGGFGLKTLATISWDKVALVTVTEVEPETPA